MDRIIARELVVNFVERLERDPATGKFRLWTVITDREVEAIRVAADALCAEVLPPPWEPPPPPPAANPAAVATPGTAAPRALDQATPAAEELSPPSSEPSTAPPGEPTAVSAPQPPAVPMQEPRQLPKAAAPARRPVDLKVDVARRARPPEDIYLCLDFGTARSKAFATRRTRDGGVDLLPLELGARAKELTKPAFGVTSSVWISSSGTIHVGQAAVTRSDAAGPTQSRIDSIKQELSQGLMVDVVPALPPDQNPSGVPLTSRDIIDLLLGYVTDLAETELLERFDLPKSIRRRFALPCWSNDRLVWGRAELRKHLTRAQVVADTFHGQWDDGIAAADLRRILDDVANIDTAHLDALIGADILEPIAAGAARLAMGPARRRLAVVVDVGAGTSDFGLFVVTAGRDGQLVYWPYENGTDVLRRAGDAVDAVLRQYILERAGVDVTTREGRLIVATLNHRIRADKERLFRTGRLNYTLSNDFSGSIAAEDLLATEGMKTLERQLHDKLRGLLERLSREELDAFGATKLEVVLTGGGATLPIVTSLAQGGITIHGRQLYREQAPALPDALEGSLGEEVEREYPTLAVAIGGALPDLPAVRSETRVKGLATRTVQKPPSFTGA